ncbi:cuticular protein analogous to peritrophins 1-I isoform X3 [Leptinotarsa decemlineata]|uniref:cuticular protein analogous to peritrophins 1-I isoform X3 n=1 Tax=Leptinotarsa decemlineata TaxID=7539 RepID=UPI003D308D90
MKGVSFLFSLGLCLSWAQAQFYNHRPFPTYSLENMPETGFSCRDKILGGYYADADTQCQMFHVCVKVAGVGVQDFRFLCPNGTAFDQDHQICADWEDIDCDSATLYYSSDNFDLYRLGSGFESKAHKYGEDEETFSLQRAETGDARINREQQSNVINQRKEPRNYNPKPKQHNQNYNNEKDIFKGSSSSNFYNNRNNGKEKDEDYDDNINLNQDRDYEQKRKVVRNKNRRPVQNNDNNRNQNGDYNRNTQNNDYNRNRNQNGGYDRNTQTNDYNRNNQNSEVNNQKENDFPEAQTRRSSPGRNTGFSNNFAGSSYVPTTARSTSTTLNAEQYSTAITNYRSRNGQRQRQYTDTESSSYTASSPAPFRQTQQYNSPPNRQNNNGQYHSTTQVPQKETENYPQKPKQTTAFDNYDVPKVRKVVTPAAQNYNAQYDTPKAKQFSSTSAQSYNTQYEATKSKFASTTAQYEATKIKPSSTTAQKTENYPSNNPKYNAFDKKQTTPVKSENLQTTLSPKPFTLNNFPTTFAPRTNAGYTQIAQQTVNYNRKSSDQTTQYGQSTGFGQLAKNSTPRSSPFTQYTPTVPKLSSTTPVSRSSRFDETQYDDGSYSTKYDYDGDKKDDEFLKTAHSQNIAASRNELAKSTKQQPSTQTQRSYDSPRPFSVTSKVTELPKTSPKPVESKKPTLNPKKTKDVSYDYAYYDSNVGSEPDYAVNEDIQKSTGNN